MHWIRPEQAGAEHRAQIIYTQRILRACDATMLADDCNHIPFILNSFISNNIIFDINKVASVDIHSHIIGS